MDINKNYNLPSIEDEIDIKEILYTVLRNKWIIIVSFLVVVILTVIYSLRLPKIYESSSLLLIEKQNNSSINPFSSMMGNSQFKINNEIEILKSRSLAKRTIETLKNNYSLDSLYLLEKGAEPNKESILSKMFSIFKKKKEENNTININVDNGYINRLKGSINVETIRETQTIKISLKSMNPDECAIIINTFVEEYKKTDLERASSSSGKIKSFLSVQLEKIEKKLSISEDKLQEYQQKEGIVNLDENSKILIEKSSEFESTYFTAIAEKEIISTQITHLKDNLSKKEIDLLDEALRVANPMIIFLKSEIAKKEAQLARYGDSAQNASENVLSIKKDIQNLQNRITKETKLLLDKGYVPGPESPFKSNQKIIEDILTLETEKISLNARIKEYKKLNTHYLDQLSTLPKKNVDFIRLTRNQQVNEKLYIMMKQKFEESRINEASEIGAIYVIDKAIPNIKPIKPKKKMNVLIGAILGLGLGFSIVFIKESLDNSLKSKEDFEKLGVTTLAVIPKIGDHKGKKHISDKDYLKAKLITHQEPRSPISEAFRSFRTNIELTQIDKKLTTYAVTSATSGEGKTTVIVNLAISFAQFGHKTLLIDADMRKPVINKMFNIDRSPGLSELIIKKSTMEETIRKTGIPNLSILPSGTIPPNPAELIGSDKMGALIKELRKKYDKIFIDAPPVLAVTDPILVGKIVDGLFFVSRAEMTDIELIKHALDTIKTTNLPLIGAVINEVSLKTMLYGKYYRYYHYHYKYEE